MTVLYDLDASSDPALDRLGHAGVDTDIRAPVGGSLHRCPQLVLGESGHVERLCGEAVPPPAVSLICEAPSSNCSRVRMRTSSGESPSWPALSYSAIVNGAPSLRGSSWGERKSP